MDTDRFVAAVPYLLPLFDAFSYGRHLMYDYPGLRSIFEPIIPMMNNFKDTPYASVIVFFILYFFVVNNSNMSRFTRFNAMQALALDLCLVVPKLIELVVQPGVFGLSHQLYANFQSFVWLFATAWITFAICSSLAGKWVRIPYVADVGEKYIR